MPSAVTNNLSASERIQQKEQKIHAEALDHGRMVIKSTERVIQHGQEVLIVTYGERNRPKLKGSEKVKEVFTAFAGTVGSVGFGLASPELRKKWQRGFEGEVTKKVTYVAFDPTRNSPLSQLEQAPVATGSGGTESAVQATIRYNPKNQASVASRAETLKQQKKLMGHAKEHPHTFYLETGRKGISSFIFCPNGDTTKAFSVVFWNSQTGYSITNKNDALLAIYDYCISYDNIERSIDKAADKLIEQMQENSPNVQVNKQDVIKKLKAFPMEINSSNNEIFIHSHRSSGSRTGIKLEGVTEATFKSIGEAHGRREQGKDKELDGENPYADDNPNSNTRNSAHSAPSNPAGQVVVDEDDDDFLQPNSRGRIQPINGSLTDSLASVNGSTTDSLA